MDNIHPTPESTYKKQSNQLPDSYNLDYERSESDKNTFSDFLGAGSQHSLKKLKHQNTLKNTFKDPNTSLTQQKKQVKKQLPFPYPTNLRDTNFAEQHTQGKNRPQCQLSKKKSKQKATIYIKYDNPHLTGFQIARVFEKFGPIKNVFFGQAKKNQDFKKDKSKLLNYVFVSYINQEDTNKAVKARTFVGEDGTTFSVQKGLQIGDKKTKKNKKQPNTNHPNMNNMIDMRHQPPFHNQQQYQFQPEYQRIEYSQVYNEGGFRFPNSHRRQVYQHQGMARYVEFTRALIAAISKDRLYRVQKNHFVDGNVRLNHREEEEGLWQQPCQDNYFLGSPNNTNYHLTDEYY